MGIPDIGLPPPPPQDVASQLQPSSGNGQGAPDLGTILAQLSQNLPDPLSADLTPKILEVQPLLSQLAAQVPAMGPDVDQLNVQLKSRMGGLPSALAGLNNQGPPPNVTPTPAGPGSMGPMDQGAPMNPQGPPMPPQMPTSPGPTGAMDTAMQLEVKLPAIGSDDETLMPYIQGFIARMREEVPKVVSGETETINPPTQSAPTDSMLSQIPVSV